MAPWRASPPTTQAQLELARVLPVLLPAQPEAFADLVQRWNAAYTGFEGWNSCDNVDTSSKAAGQIIGGSNSRENLKDVPEPT